MFTRLGAPLTLVATQAPNGCIMGASPMVENQMWGKTLQVSAGRWLDVVFKRGTREVYPALLPDCRLPAFTLVHLWPLSWVWVVRKCPDWCSFHWSSERNYLGGSSWETHQSVSPSTLAVACSVSPSWMQCYPLGSSYLVGRVLSIGFIEFFVFDSGPLPYLLFIVFQVRSYFSFSCSWLNLSPKEWEEHEHGHPPVALNAATVGSSFHEYLLQQDTLFWILGYQSFILSFQMVDWICQ